MRYFSHFSFFYNSWKKKTLALKTFFKQGKMINERHKRIIILLQVSNLATRDPIQRDRFWGLF